MQAFIFCMLSMMYISTATDQKQKHRTSRTVLLHGADNSAYDFRQFIWRKSIQCVGSSNDDVIWGMLSMMYISTATD